MERVLGRLVELKDKSKKLRGNLYCLIKINSRVEEERAVQAIKINIKYFFQYAESKAKIRTARPSGVISDFA